MAALACYLEIETARRVPSFLCEEEKRTYFFLNFQYYLPFKSKCILKKSA